MSSDKMNSKRQPRIPRGHPSGKGGQWKETSGQRATAAPTPKVDLSSPQDAVSENSRLQFHQMKIDASEWRDGVPLERVREVALAVVEQITNFPKDTVLMHEQGSSPTTSIVGEWDTSLLEEALSGTVEPFEWGAMEDIIIAAAPLLNPRTGKQAKDNEENNLFLISDVTIKSNKGNIGVEVQSYVSAGDDFIDGYDEPLNWKAKTLIGEREKAISIALGLKPPDRSGVRPVIRLGISDEMDLSKLPKGCRWDSRSRQLVLDGDGPGDLLVNIDSHLSTIRPFAVVRDGAGDGDVVVDGPGAVHVVRRGVGSGNAIRRGNGGGDVLREGTGRGDAIHSGDKLGNAIRTDDGDGHAMREGDGQGDATRSGGGNGNAIRRGENLGGNAIRSGDGEGNAIHEGGADGDAVNHSSRFGDAIRRGTGAGDAIRGFDGVGDAMREGSGDGNAIRNGSGNGMADCKTTGRGDAIRQGDGNGDSYRKLGPGKAIREGNGWGDAKVLSQEKT